MMTAARKVMSRDYPVTFQDNRAMSFDYSKRRRVECCSCKPNKGIGSKLNSLESAMTGLRLQDIGG